MTRLSNSTESPQKPPAFTGPSAKRLLLTMAALAAGYMILLAYLHRQTEAKVAEVFGGHVGINLLKHPDKIEAYRIGKIADDLRWPNIVLSDYPIEKGPINVPQPDAETLVTTLLDEKSYDWDAAKACIPQPGVRIDFTHGNDQLSVLLCYECKILETYLNGKSTSGQDFDYAQPSLVRIARHLFPDDPKIQALRDEELTPSHAK